MNGFSMEWIKSPLDMLLEGDTQIKFNPSSKSHTNGIAGYLVDYLPLASQASWLRAVAGFTDPNQIQIQQSQHTAPEEAVGYLVQVD